MTPLEKYLGRKLTPVEQKLEAQRESMGSRYLCHPSRQVKRLAVPLSDSAGVDIRATFDRVRAEPLVIVERVSK